MADLEEITETSRTAVNVSSSDEEKDPTPRGGTKLRRSKNRRIFSGPQGPSIQPPLSFQSLGEKRKENEIVEERLRQPPDSPKLGIILTKGDHRTVFYENYHKVAEDYDEGFLKRRDEDLNTTLIFAGLLSVVTSAFIIQVDSQLKPDPGDETAALLRVLIYKIDNTTFGSSVPALPQWSGPPRTTVQVEAILFASLAVSLFSAFLAMLGKQWLNRYESTDMRGSVVERSHNRQRKLGGIAGWYFDHVIASSPLMLQVALLLLGCALSRYLWEIDITIASVVLGVTSFGAIFYLFIIIAGTASERFPYQTPAANVCRRILRHLRHHLLPSLHSAVSAIPRAVSSNISRLFRISFCGFSYYECLSNMGHPWYSADNAFQVFLAFVCLPIGLAWDAYLLGRATLRMPVALCKRAHHQLVGGPWGTHQWFINISSLRTLAQDEQSIALDLQCISWILQTSLDKTVHLSALKYLTLMPNLAYFHPTLVFDCFNIFTWCIGVSNGKVVVIQGLEQLASVSANAFSRTLHHLATMDPTSSALADIQRRYNEAFPSKVDFTSLPFHSAMVEIHTLTGRFGNPRDIRCHNYRMSVQEHIPFARHMVQAAQERYQRSWPRKVPCWILRSALYFLSLAPVSPPSVVADCLTIVAIDLGCDVANTVSLEEGARVEHISNIITQTLEYMAKTNDAHKIFSKRKAINTLFPYAIFLEQGGQQGMIDAILCAARVSDSAGFKSFMWHHVVLYLSRLFETRSPKSLDRGITLISPHIPWEGKLNNTIAVSRWAAAVLATPYTEEVIQNVVIALFQISSIDHLRPYIPTEIWMLLKRQKPLPPTFCGQRCQGAHTNTIIYIRRLGDFDLLKSYFLLVWADNHFLPSKVIREMERSIREDFSRAGTERYRIELTSWLNNALNWQPHPVPKYSFTKRAKAQRMRLRELLLEVNG